MASNFCNPSGQSIQASFPSRSGWKTLVLVLLTLLMGTEAATARERREIVYAFRNYERARPLKMILVGEIKSKKNDCILGVSYPVAIYPVAIR